MRNADLKKEVDRYKREIDESKREMRRLKRCILEQHKLGFSKALNQATFFYKILANYERFDVGKDFNKGELMPISEISIEDLEDVGNVESADLSHTSPLREETVQPEEPVEIIE